MDLHARHHFTYVRPLSTAASKRRSFLAGTCGASSHTERGKARKARNGDHKQRLLVCRERLLRLTVRSPMRSLPPYMRTCVEWWSDQNTPSVSECLS